MWQVLKAVLVWLMVLAIPTQGIAASTMLHCGPNHMQQSRAATELDHARHGHAHQGDAHHDQADGIAAAPGVTTDAGLDQGGHADAAAKLAKFKCSACASCCSAVAILHVVSPLPVIDCVFEGAPSPLIGRPGFFTDGPERPPRITLG